MAEDSNAEYFFGFCKFFPFGNGKQASSISGIQENREGKTFCSIPTKIVAEHELVCVTWANIYYLNKKNGKIKVCGRSKGRNISPEEDVLLPLDTKCVSFSACWDKLLLTTDQGRCHVMAKVYDDWTVDQVTSYDANHEKRFLFGSLGESHCIAVDNCGAVCEIKENDISKFIYHSVFLGVYIDQVTCGKEHVVMLNKKHGMVYSYGLGSRGQLGLGEATPEKSPKLIEALAGIRITQIASGGWHSLALSEFADVYAWGWNNCGQLGITCVPPEVPLSFYMLPYLVDFPMENCVVTHVVCGSRHSVAVTSESQVWTWGWGYYGQLGHGDREDRKTPTLVEYFRNMKSEIMGVTCGPWQTVVHTKLTTA